MANLLHQLLRLDYVSCVLTILGTILLGRKLWQGWVVAAVNSAVVCVIGVRTAQFGFVPANLLCIALYTSNLVTWRLRSSDHAAKQDATEGANSRAPRRTFSPPHRSASAALPAHNDRPLPSKRASGRHRDPEVERPLRSEEHTSELQSRLHLVCRLLLEKKTNPATLTYTQALEEALCQGWIDGQKRSCDATTLAQRITDRRTASQRSQSDLRIAEDLIAG